MGISTACHLAYAVSTFARGRSSAESISDPAEISRAHHPGGEKFLRQGLSMPQASTSVDRLRPATDMRDETMGSTSGQRSAVATDTGHSPHHLVRDNRSAKPDVLHSCAKSPAQTRTLAKRDSMCHEMSHELFHPTCKALSAMPLPKVDDAERKGQRRAASPSERGRRSERASRSKAS